MILPMQFQMFGQVFDALRQHGYLDIGRPGVRRVKGMCFANFFFSFFCNAHTRIRLAVAVSRMLRWSSIQSKLDRPGGGARICDVPIYLLH
jgi:hypothetical protein